LLIYSNFSASHTIDLSDVNTDEWKTLSSSIQGTNIRKKNLVEGTNLVWRNIDFDQFVLTVSLSLCALTCYKIGNVYHFRVRCKLSTGWDDYSAKSTDIKVSSIFLLL
jgi:hypothetical protein